MGHMSFGERYSGRRLEGSVIPDWKRANWLSAVMPIESRRSGRDISVMGSVVKGRVRKGGVDDEEVNDSDINIDARGRLMTNCT
jgi:hypothetical protein